MAKLFSLLRKNSLCICAAIVLMVGLSGCSRLGLGDQELETTGFPPIPPREIVSEIETAPEANRQTVDQILDRQAAMLRAQQLADREQEAIALQVANDQDTMQQASVIGNSIAPTTRATLKNVLSPSRESTPLPGDVRLTANTEDIPAVSEFEDDSFEVELEAIANSLRTTSVELNPELASGTRPFQLKPSLSTELIDSPAAPAIESQAIRIGPPTTASRLLQPTLFNPATRSPTGEFNGTLREQENESITLSAELAFALEPPIAEPEAEVPVAIEPPEVTPQEPAVIETVAVEPDQPEEELEPPVIVAEEKVEIIAGTVVEFDETPQVVTPQVATPQVATPQVKSFQPSVIATQFVPGIVARPELEMPVVDSSLSSQVETALEQSIPAAVFEDAIRLAEEVSEEIVTQPIPSIEVDPNQFPVIATGAISPLQPLRPQPPVEVEVEPTPCESCGHSDCPGCKLDAGEPSVQQTEFASPSMPAAAGSFVPMAIPASAQLSSGDFVVAKPQTHNGSQAAIESQPILPETLGATIGSELDSPSVAELAPAPQKQASRVPPLGLDTLMELNAVTWQSRLDQAIELAENNQTPDNAASMEVSLRLLRALRGQMDHLQTANLQGGSMQDQESRYWQHQLEAITAMLEVPVAENQALTDYNRHNAAHQTLNHLRMAVEQLESIANLRVVGGQLCTEIMGFGQYRLFSSNRFEPGQKMLVYCEVENYQSLEQASATGSSFRTKLRGSFAIYDGNGKVVQQAEFPAAEDVSMTRRRDFYMYLPLTLGQLPPGDYALNVMVEDINGNKTASLEPGIQFSVGGRVAVQPVTIR